MKCRHVCIVTIHLSVQDKDQAAANKAMFLTQLGDAVMQATGQPVDCNVKQVLRGKDPEGANRLLQALAVAASSRQAGASAMQVQPAGCHEQAPDQATSVAPRSAQSLSIVHTHTAKYHACGCLQSCNELVSLALHHHSRADWYTLVSKSYGVHI